MATDWHGIIARIANGRSSLPAIGRMSVKWNHMSKMIEDEFTDLPLTRQRKWQMRNRDKLAEYQSRYKKSAKGKAANKRYREKTQTVDKSIYIGPE
jgi:hypothetical protein